MNISKLIMSLLCMLCVLGSTHELMAGSNKTPGKKVDDAVDKAKDTFDDAKKKGKDTFDKTKDKLDDFLNPKKK